MKRDLFWSCKTLKNAHFCVYWKISGNTPNPVWREPSPNPTLSALRASVLGPSARRFALPHHFLCWSLRTCLLFDNGQQLATKDSLHTHRRTCQTLQNCLEGVDTRQQVESHGNVERLNIVRTELLTSGA